MIGFETEGITIHLGDCIESMQSMPAGIAQTCITSPPYWGLRDYGVEGQIGLESTPEEYVTQIVAVFREVRRVLSDDATLWLNLGDSYAGSWGAQSRLNGNDAKSTLGGGSMLSARQIMAAPKTTHTGSVKNTPGLKPKDLIGIPWRVALALQADGWYLRQDIIWHKPNPMPESVQDRCTKAHEYIFLLAKSDCYYFDNEGIQEPAVCGSNGSEFHTGKTGEHQMGRASTKPRPAGNKTHKHATAYEQGDERHRTKAGLVAMGGQIRETRNKRSVWTVPTKPYRGAHFATFPQALIEPCVKSGCPEGGVVLDPFTGSGTTAYVARKLGRKFIGCELNPAYIELAAKRLKQLVLF